MASLSHIFPGGFNAALHSTDLVDPVGAFKDFCRTHGLVVEDVVDDGEIHRCQTVDSKRGSLDGWYILHTDSKMPVGICGSWKTPDVRYQWMPETGRTLTFAEQVEHRKWVDEVKAKQKALREVAQAQAAERAEEEVQSYLAASADHPYLQRKQVRPHGIKIDRAGRLVIQITTADGEIISYQTIDTEGNKRYLRGGRKDGGFYEIRGTSQVVYIAEGFETAASVHEATGATVLVAFDAGNLPKVAKAAKARFLTSKLVIAADNDQFTDGNPGIKAATEAASLVNGVVIHPSFSESEIASGKPTDFNDLHVLRGIDAVREQIQMVVDPIRSTLAFEFSKIGEIELKPIEWIVEDYIEADSLAQVFGDPGGGKSFVAIDIACCVATGTKWHGHDVKQGAVFYIAGEGHNGLNRRFKAWELGHDVRINEAPIYKSHRAAQLYDATEAAKVSQSIEQIVKETGVKPVLVIIDTLARNMGGDENSTQDMNAFIKHLDTFLKEPYRCCVMVVHHSGTGDKDRGRGSSAMKGAIDAEYKVALHAASKTIQITSVKMKDAELPPAKHFALTQIELGIKDKNDQPVKGAYLSDAADISGFVKAASQNKALGKNQKACLESLKELAKGANGLAPVGRDQWRDHSKKYDLDRKRWGECRDWLVNHGMVLEKDGSYYLPDSSDSDASETSETSESDAFGQDGQI